jgi:hypothetical protein
MGARDLLCELTGAGFHVEAAGDKLVIRPASKLTDELRAALREAKPELLLALTRTTCTGCRHLGRARTCLQPVEAGLADSFTIVWPPKGHAATCSGFIQGDPP